MVLRQILILGVVLDSLLDNQITVRNEARVLIQGQLSDSSDQLSTVHSIANTPIKFDVLCKFLENYSNKTVASELYLGFLEGFRLNYTGPRMTTDCRNLVSVFGNEVEVANKLLKEMNLGRIAGPFNNIPLFNLRLSPIGLCPKKDGSWRLIQHLSYPHGLSVNDYIDKGLCSVTYTPFDHALDMVGSQGKFALIGKKKISARHLGFYQ
ncbi:Hypothetical predicted protein [Mytilus galloprovincialis]|uniref:Uncharacterized protein n=1 Tax=Mytilus galloprovincialis TaxID=29158 RepID=A0A8B6ECE6_MYTGA|nr:Hypothetical predicted protein [Mytilus galloprovincialis]